MARGLSVIQGDADRDLIDYPDRRLRLRHPVAHHPGDAPPQGGAARTCCASAGAPSSRSPISATGACAPAAARRAACRCTENLPEPWYETPNAHLCTIADFDRLCQRVDAVVERAVAFNWSGRQLPATAPRAVQNLLGEKAVFLLRRRSVFSRAAAAGLAAVRKCRPRGRDEAGTPAGFCGLADRCRELLASFHDDDPAET